MAALLAPVPAAAQGEAPNPFARKYTEGEVIVFTLRATNQDRERTLSYSARAQGIVRRDPAGFYEEYEWTDLVVDGNPIAFPEANQKFRQRVSLAPESPTQIPNWSQVHPSLVGPIFDLLNFYSDLALAARMPGLSKTGDRVFYGHNRSHSWADGRAILVGEDAIDFDVTLRELNAADRTATLAVRHIPPASPAINLVADWMRAPVAKGENNWTQVVRYPPGKYTASVGREEIEVTLVIDVGDGKPLSGTMENTIEVRERECEDAVAAKCGAPRSYRIKRSAQLIPVTQPSLRSEARASP
jgi:hypothetical protein